MGLPLFKTPVEPGITAATMERFLASARSSIRRNRLCESRLDPSRRTMSGSRRIWRAEPLLDDEAGDSSREPDQYHTPSDIDSPSATWNSRVIRIIENNRERTRLTDESELEHQHSPIPDPRQYYSNTEVTENLRSDGTSLQIARARRSRTNRLRRMAGRHSLLSRPAFYNEFYPRLTSPTSVINTPSSNTDDRGHRNLVSRSEIDIPHTDTGEISALRGNSRVSGTAHQPRSTGETLSQSQIDQLSANPWQVLLDLPSLNNRSNSPTSETLWERILRFAPYPEINSEESPRVGNDSLGDVSSSTSESAHTDKVEGSPTNIDRILEDRRDVENESIRQEILGRNPDRWRTYADVVAERDNLLYQSDRVRINSSNDWHHVPPRFGDQDGPIDE